MPGRANDPAAEIPEAGFTLLELLVVLFIMVLLVSQIPPLFTRGVAGVRLQGAVTDIADDLRMARATAIRTSHTADVTFDRSSRSYVVTGNKQVRKLADDVGVTITAVTWAIPGSTQAGIEFLPDGSSSGGELAVTQGSRIYRIVIDWLTGRVTIRD
jgi:general secretion pathway protein H